MEGICTPAATFREASGAVAISPGAVAIIPSGPSAEAHLRYSKRCSMEETTSPMACVWAEMRAMPVAPSRLRPPAGRHSSVYAYISMGGEVWLKDKKLRVPPTL